MKTRTTWIWIALSVAIVAGYFYTGTLKEKDERAAFEAKRLFQFEGKDIVRLSFRTLKNDTVEATRVSPNIWEMMDPYAHVNPNHGLWTQLAEQVVPMLINQRPIEATPDDLTLYGLTDPPLSVTVETAQKELIQLDIGTADPTQNNHYAKLASGEIFLLPVQMAKTLYRSLDELRDRRVFPLDATKIDTVRYVRYPVDDQDDDLEPEPGIDEEYVLKAAENKWYFTKPGNALVNLREIVTLLNEAQQLRGIEFIDSPSALGDYGLNPPWAKLTLLDSDENTSRTLWLGWLDDLADDGRMFATIEGNPSVFTIDAAFLSNLPQDPIAFREDHLLTSLPSTIAIINYRDAQRDLTLTNDDTVGWVLTEPAFPDTDNLAVSNLIRALMAIVGTRFPDDEEVAAQFGDEQIVYSFTFNNGAPPSTIVIGAMVPDTTDPVMFYVRQDFGSVTTIPFHYVQLLTSSTFRFRNHDLLPFEPESVTALSIQLDDSRYTLTLTNGTWIVTDPPDHIVENKTDVDVLINKLRGVLAAGDIDSELENDVTGLENPALIADVTISTPDGTQVLGPITLGNLVADGSRYRYGRVTGRPETFYVDHSIIEDLRIGLKGIRPNGN